MKLKNILVSCMGIILLFSSCSDYLDVAPEDDILDIPAIFETRDGAERWMKSAYRAVPFLYGGEFSDPGILGGDEYVAGQYARATRFHSMFYIGDGLQSTVEPYGNLWTYDGIYNTIRYCNTFLDHIDEVYNLYDGELETWTAEVKAVKAYYYFEMVKRYGPIVLVPENIDVWAPLEEMQVARSHVDSCFAEIVSLLDAAIPDLKLISDKNPERYQYFSKEGALALKAKVLLYHASPLFNGNSNYSNFTNRDGELLFNQEYNNERWKIAAEAVDEAITLCEGVGYQLISGSTETSTSLLNNMRDIELSIWAPNYSSTEGIMLVSASNTLSANTLPAVGTSAENFHYDVNVFGDIGTSIKMVESFYTKNGLPIDQDNTWDYEGRYKMGRETSTFYKNVVDLSQDVLLLHLKREPRFYANIASSGTYWQRGTYSWSENNLLMETYKGQDMGLKQNNIDPNYPQNLTGYWVKKGTRSEVPTNNYGTQLNGLLGFNLPTPAIRLADLYLMQSEAWNEYEGPQGSNSEKIFSSLNKIRERAGIPTVQDSWTKYSKSPSKITTKEGMRDIIRQERTIELAFEGHRFWDLRRWKTAQSELNKKPRGWNVLGADAREYFNNYEGPLVVWDKAEFQSPRDYFFPIKSEEVIISGVVQNPEW
ncbi:RagB/SusD family nutrient uptake outer membrane protein [Thalassobellus citreus]|uniref:RagB/SusD family nutrient uptake outer membrane protein n=1 Tax=Thalassobellus citreus TaxID=3367752 RepID=UPI0037BD49C8